MTETAPNIGPTSSDHRPEDMVLSFLTMRRILGCLGLSLPVALVVGGVLDDCCVRPYLSDYYYSPNPIVHGLFVGIMCALGVFLISYRGYPREKGDILGDNWVTTVTGIGALGVAIFPIAWCTGGHCCPSTCIIGQADCHGIRTDAVFSRLHNASAFLFFMAAAAITGLLFTKGKNCYQSDEEKTQKRRRNVVYRVCSGIIIVCVAAIVVGFIEDNLFREFLKYRVILVLQSIAVWAFGTAWLVKGRPLWRAANEETQPKPPSTVPS